MCKEKSHPLCRNTNYEVIFIHGTNPYEFTSSFLFNPINYTWLEPHLVCFLAKLASSQSMYHIQKDSRSSERKPSSCI